MRTVWKVEKQQQQQRLLVVDLAQVDWMRAVVTVWMMIVELVAVGSEKTYVWRQVWVYPVCQVIHHQPVQLDSLIHPSHHYHDHNLHHHPYSLLDSHIRHPSPRVVPLGRNGSISSS